MEYPYSISISVNNIFGERDVPLTLYSGVTTFVGTNGSGKTQTLKALRDFLKNQIGSDKVRYLTSNRIGTMEQYRSKTTFYNYLEENLSLGDRRQKQVRHQIETANGDFFTMDERKDVYIKVAERLSVLFNRQIFLRWDAGELKVFFQKTESQEEYSVAAEASGLVNIISILAALFDESIEVLLIDEPEVSLHPQLQSYLLREIEDAPQKYGKTIILSTHSAEMIDLNSAEELCNFVFFRETDLPIQIVPSTPELYGQKLKDFLFRMGLIYKEAFFAKKVFLIEGSSDLILCRYLSHRFRLNLDVAGTQIIPVEGKGQFAVIAKLFRMIGKEVCLLTDLDGFIDDNNVTNIFAILPESTKIANECGHDSLQEMIRSAKTKLEELILPNKDTMKEIYQSHPYWLNRDVEANEEKSIRRSIVAELFLKRDEDIETWSLGDEWVSIKKRLTAIMDVLEKVGCFILRKGAIESYYLYASKKTFDGKPSAASLEVSQLEQCNDAVVQQQYSDCIRALKFAALNKNVDESNAVKKELLSELALVLGILNEETTENLLTTEIKRAKGSNQSLFSYQIIRESKGIGVEISLRSTIIDVTGFPFKIFKGDNVNSVVESTVCAL